ncbi:MAG: hypothetical protein SPE30_11865 [Candidatus Treponema excrementipullorum]|nr:hypothetical protein [Candidatus Treponema excrementipullorum]
MRIVLMHFLNPENTKHSQIIRNLVDSASKKGHTVEVIDGQKDMSTFRFTPYEYIALLTPTLGVLGGKVPPIVSEVLANCGVVGGKKSCALVLPSLFGAEKACKALMKAMEKEGMFVDYFDIVQSPEHATHVGTFLG